MAQARGLGKGVFGRSFSSGLGESLSFVLVRHAVHPLVQAPPKAGARVSPVPAHVLRHLSGMAKTAAKENHWGSSTERSGVLDRSRSDDNSKEFDENVVMG